MFALEINFNDGVSPPEIILVRRPHAIIGTSEFAHVVIEGAPSIPCELRVSRGIGREFHCLPLKKGGVVNTGGPLPEGTYHGSAQLSLGSVVTHVTALDIDLLMTPNESPDRAGVRVLRSALSAPAPTFPAVAVLGSVPLFVSFPANEPLIVGRSRKCGLRLDSSGISSEHARIGFEKGAFWVEDLGSTNGTFLGGERVSGRRIVGADQTIVVGNEFVLAGVRDREDLELLSERAAPPVSEFEEQRYPCLVTASDLVRPNRVVLVPGRPVGIGRDPANDVWVGAAHISRNHCQVTVTDDGAVQVLDQSTNGTYVNDERITRGDSVVLDAEMVTVDLKEGVLFGICRSESSETRFLGHAPRAGLSRRDDESLEPSVLDRSVESSSRGDDEVGNNPSVFQSMARRQRNGEAPRGEDLFAGDRVPSPEEAAAALTAKYTIGELEEGEGIQTQIESSRMGGVRWFGILLVVAGLIAVVLLIVGLMTKA